MHSPGDVAAKQYLKLPGSCRRVAAFAPPHYDEAMSFSDTIFLFFLALILFGPKKLPGMARQAGRLLAELRRASNEFKSQIETEIAHLETEKPTILPPSPPPQGTVASVSSNPAAERTCSAATANRLSARTFTQAIPSKARLRRPVRILTSQRVQLRRPRAVADPATPQESHV